MKNSRPATILLKIKTFTIVKVTIKITLVLLKKKHNSVYLSILVSVEHPQFSPGHHSSPSLLTHSRWFPRSSRLFQHFLPELGLWGGKYGLFRFAAVVLVQRHLVVGVQVNRLTGFQFQVWGKFGFWKKNFLLKF